MNFEAFNLNDHVRVKLNDLGFVTWKQEFEKYLPEEYHKPLSDFVARADDEGYVDFQAWNFINLFGEHVYMAGPSLFDLTILIQRPEPIAAPSPPAPRPLSSLTEEEARECYRLAFGQAAEPMKFYAASHMICISDPNWYTLTLYADGNACPKRSYSSESAAFNAVKVVRYLDSIGIALGE